MAVEERLARANANLTERFRFTTTFPDVANAAPLTLDEPLPLRDGTGPIPASATA